MPASFYNPDGFTVALQNQIDTLRLSQQLDIDGPFNVQTGALNQLLTYDTTNLKPGSIAVVNDLGGCGNNGSPGVGLAFWSGSGWRRISRGAQTAMTPASVINLDYWKDPMRITLSGTTLVPTRFLITNAPNTALYSIAKPGITSVITAFGINMLGGLSNTDITIVGPSMGLFEVVSGSLSQVQTV